ncbi:hypothetical protein Taro_025537 [Colocasia esculenta]|uniref:Uncharacterized protein n=1 Tax=Colocasia esculenta TaxID=4460 RepID=A0A843V3K9_COLES|nr:hypothetical protein [Colocasia esculenta]
MEEQPLLSERSEEEKWRSYQYVGRTGSVHLPPLSGAGISVEEIRSASSVSESYYPPSIHAALVSSPQSDRAAHGIEIFFSSFLPSRHRAEATSNARIAWYVDQLGAIWTIARCKRLHHDDLMITDIDVYKSGEDIFVLQNIISMCKCFADQALVFHGSYGGNISGPATNELGRQALDEVEIRQLLIDHVGHHWCWGSRPARTWKICAIEDCNVYVGTLETFIEERETVKEIEPYQGGKVDGKDNGSEVGVWELDLRTEFPLLYVAHKETRTNVPHSEAVEKCSGCEGRGEVACPTCNAGQEAGTYKKNQMSQCPLCYGRGLIAHRDGSDTICANCSGKGMIPCATCASRGLIQCQTCQGRGSLLARTIALVKW